MQGAGLPYLTNWQNFYIIIGAAAATLTGLMFIVITLIAGIDVHVPTVNAGLSAFNTPTVVHFCTVLLMAMSLSAPWQSFASLGLLLGLVGLAGVIYLVAVTRRMRRIPGYQTPFRDWLWYSAVPFCAYLLLVIAAAILRAKPALALPMVSVVMVVLLFTGIRNAWDLLTYLAVDRAHSGST